MAIDTKDRPPYPISRGDVLLARCLVLEAGVPWCDADDITQEVLCVLAFRHQQPRLRARRGPRRTPEQARAARIAAAARRMLAEHARRRAQLRSGDRLAAGMFSARFTPSAEDLALELEPIGRLRRALAQLRQTEPALYKLLDLTADGATMMTVAERLRLPLGTVCTRLRAARAAVCVFYRREALPRRAAGGVAGDGKGGA